MSSPYSRVPFGEPLNPGIDANGYPVTTLHYAGRRLRAHVHALVVEAFLGPRPPRCEVAHADGNPANNKLENLRYATYEENNQDRLRHGRLPLGERHYLSVVSDADRLAIIRAYRNGEKPSALARRYGIAFQTAYMICTKLPKYMATLSVCLLLVACGPLINIPASSGSGANVAPSADTQPTLCTAVEPIYMDRATAATLPKTLREDIAIQNRLIECVCTDQRKTRECKLFLLGSK